MFNVFYSWGFNIKVEDLSLSTYITDVTNMLLMAAVVANEVIRTTRGLKVLRVQTEQNVEKCFLVISEKD